MKSILLISMLFSANVFANCDESVKAAKKDPVAGVYETLIDNEKYKCLEAVVDVISGESMDEKVKFMETMGAVESKYFKFLEGKTFDKPMRESIDFFATFSKAMCQGGQIRGSTNSEACKLNAQAQELNDKAFPPAPVATAEEEHEEAVCDAYVEMKNNEALMAKERQIGKVSGVIHNGRLNRFGAGFVDAKEKLAALQKQKKFDVKNCEME